MPPDSIEPGLLGTANFTSPGSFAGLMTMTSPPRSRQCFSMWMKRGWLDDGLAPMTKIRSAPVEVLELDRRGALADGGGQPLAGRLVAIVGAVVDVVGARRPGPAAGTRSRPRSTSGRRNRRSVRLGSVALQLRRGVGDGEIPAHRLVAVAPGPLEQRRVEPAELFHLAAGELLQVAQRMEEGLVRDRRLDVGRLRLHRLVADRRELAELIGHPALLPAHAVGAGLAGVLEVSALAALPTPILRMVSTV